MQIPQQLSCDVYIPEQGALHLKKLNIRTKSQPDRICGIARRIAYTGASRVDMAIYRLKVLSEGKLVTLPIPFIIESGIFIEYEEWSSGKKTDEP